MTQPIIHMNSAQRQLYEKLIEERTGMVFGFRRQGELEQALTVGAERAGLRVEDAYYDALRQERTQDDLWDDLIRELTIGETYFFRNTGHFAALRDHILPELIERKQEDRRLRIWSAGCASGEEPFSIAMLLSELIPELHDWRITILATDINRTALQQALRAEYREWSMRQLDDVQKRRYFETEGDIYRPRSHILDMVSFGYLNLAENTFPSIATNTSALDLVVCRNVSIYFSLDTIRSMVERFAACLLPGGWMIPGAAETSHEIYRTLCPHYFRGAVIYQKPLGHQTEAPVQASLRKTVATPPIENSPRPGPERAALGPTAALGAEPDPKVSEPSLVDVALEAVARSDDARAMVLLKRMNEDGTLSEAACVLYAQLVANAGDLEETRGLCREGLETYPLAPELHYVAALVESEDGNNEEAMRGLRRALYLEPSFVLAHYAMSQALLSKGKLVRAQRHSERARSLIASMPEDRVLDGSIRLTAGELGRMLWRLG